MEDVLTHVDDPNIVRETMTSRQTYLSVKRPEKIPSVKLCNNYSDFTRETFIYRMLESPQARGIVAKVAKDLNINYCTATEEVAYKKFEENNGPKCSFTTEHNEYIKEQLDNDPQLYSDDIINSLTKRFEVFTISKSQLNNHLRNIMLITVKKPMFEPEIRNPVGNLQTRFEWFMEWKDSDLDFIFIDEAGFHINMRNN
ncbi:hypothetical protein BCV72DRAFT_253335 [Rhizopus microsporus var. microsporus]|uniref:Tc1-like transposase DDE domain-containing protein n=1 Tax=Rhizopus microsporus var. microsporus TaxID=86635 RepID=A0A1X0QML6_RHIZD|nr:hypothetical protein BCV72DRAFT_253335 [Rhizopus microsporus var. microsporus]